MVRQASGELPAFADNFNRLLGLHRLSQHSPHSCSECQRQR